MFNRGTSLHAYLPFLTVRQVLNKSKAESLVHRLKLKRDSNKIPVTGVGDAVSMTRGAVTMVISSHLVDDCSIEVEA